MNTLDARRANPVLWDSAASAVLLAVGLGVYFAAQPSDASAVAGPAFDNMRALMPLRLWGAVFVAKGVAAAVALASGDWRYVRTVAVAGIVPYLAYALVLAQTAVLNSWTGYIGALLSLFVAFAHICLARAAKRLADLLA